MALYLGSSKKKLSVGSHQFKVNVLFPTTNTVINKTSLRSLDNKILMDKNGIYIVAKESE